jgi:hypothetical protein
MRAQFVVVGVLGSACGGVSSIPPADASLDGSPDAPVETPTMYKGNVAQTSPPVLFGGPPPNCGYSATLTQIAIKLAILPSGRVTGGTVQDLYVEGTDANCQGPPAPLTIMNFTFTSATPSPTGMTLKFQEEAGNKPGASLVIELSVVTSAYQTRLTFHRTDLGPPLDWTVVTTAALTPQ